MADMVQKGVRAMEEDHIRTQFQRAVPEGWKLPPELKKKWVVALRSGEYPQGSQVLRRINTVLDTKYEYCCLGVLCDVLDVKWTPDSGGVLFSCSSDGHYEYVSSEVFDIPFRLQEEIANLNDSGTSFAEIADLIEELL